MEADSINADLKNSASLTLRYSTKFKFAALTATDYSNLNLETEGIKSIQSAIGTTVMVRGKLQTLNKLVLKK